jgi:hypothetical protein
MPMMRCPQCGTEFERGTLEFCPNPTCGYPVAFAEEPKSEEAPPAMERRPGEAVTPDQQATTHPIAPAPPPPPPPQPPPPKPPGPKKNRRPLIMAGGIGAAVIVAGVAVFALTRGDGGEVDPGQTTTTPGTGGGTIVTPSVSPPEPGPLAWGQLVQSDLAGEGNQGINALSGPRSVDSEDDPRFIAAGFADSPDGDPDAAVWVSVDGSTWERVEDDDFGGPGEQRINGIFNTGGTLFVVGVDRSNVDADGAVWSSTDGLSWDRRGEDQLRKPGDQVMVKLRGGTAVGLIAVGTDGSDAGMWISADGSSWTQLLEDDFSDDGAQAINRVEEIAEPAPGGPSLVAVGFDTSGGDRDAAVWVSSDGESWSLVGSGEPPFELPGDQELVDLADTGGLLIAVGSDESEGEQEGALWLSEDGVSWTRLGDESPFQGAGDQSVTRIVAPERAPEGAPRIIAAGFDGSNAALWYSDDGQAWIRDPDPDGAFAGTGDQSITSLGVRGTPVLAVGIDTSSSGDLDAAVWQGVVS